MVSHKYFTKLNHHEKALLRYHIIKNFMKVKKKKKKDTTTKTTTPQHTISTLKQ